MRVLGCVEERPRGQSGFEFMFMMMLGLIVMGVLLVLIGRLTYTYSEEQRTATMMALGRQIQDELILAATVHEGYERSFTLPERVDRFDYIVTTSGTLLTIDSGRFTQSFRIPEVSGSLQIGINTIINQGGTLHIV